MAFQIEADLPPVFACLKNVDALLRCPICFDFLNISMMTKCSHNFCSLCIRKFLCYKLQCPVCNTKATEQDLRTNRLLDDLVVNFQAARQKLSKANYESSPISATIPTSAVKCKTPRERGQNCNSSVLNHFFQKRPKTSPTKETQRDGSVTQSAERRKIQTAHTHNANDADLHSATDQLPVVVKKEPMDVECPVCSVSVPQQFINKHLDTCLTRGEKKESLRSSLGNARRPMTKLVYNLLSMQELKKRLKECHLSMQGSRDQLIKRHQDFVHVYNAQCDSLNPKSAEDIAKDLEVNEKIRNQLQGKAKPVMVFAKNQSEKEIDEIHSNYRKQHSSDFSRLIAQVRCTRIKQEVTMEGEDAQKTHSADQVAGSKSCSVMKIEDIESDAEPPARRIERSSSPTYSDVSISSSISDIFGPEPARHPESCTKDGRRDTEKTSVQKRTSSMRGDKAASSLVSGKRRRKT
ncbi:E3 ubiquitin-protein ligase RAD18 isoform X2 [Cyclopterus lumpus]|uniref:E3 ubiquitin-protein ligase RAD18 isoform X2 n=1 Tax=Cyclopterus lumpus TaxID=8103 RepID=UPI00148694E2|nr:E3 ubiquitin-protein ligase RAD18 isoform X2 [Cyclopterus lumpus]